jgi:hypothetical protein
MMSRVSVVDSPYDRAHGLDDPPLRFLSGCGEFLPDVQRFGLDSDYEALLEVAGNVRDEP